MTVQLRTKAGLVAAAALSAVLVAACAAAPNAGRTAVADGVRFDYALAPKAGAGAYHLTLALADAKTGAAVSDANVAVDVYGPGVESGTLINLTKDAGATPAYGADVALPQAASYRLTFQVNRPSAPSAQAVFSAQRPASAG
jgi:hypothetical protein